MTRRSRAREVALQLLFQRDQNPTPVPRDVVEKFARDRLLGDTGMTAYCLGLYDGTLAHLGEIDTTLSAAATNWRLSRMQPADRSILRMAVFELSHDSSPPPLEVVIDEAIELARRFGSVESPGFVNGVLDRISKATNTERGAGNDTVPPSADAAPETPAIE